MGTGWKKVKGVAKEHKCMTHACIYGVGMPEGVVGGLCGVQQRGGNWDNCNSINNKTSKRKKIYNI